MFLVQWLFSKFSDDQTTLMIKHTSAACFLCDQALVLMCHYLTQLHCGPGNLNHGKVILFCFLSLKKIEIIVRVSWEEPAVG